MELKLPESSLCIGLYLGLGMFAQVATRALSSKVSGHFISFFRQLLAHVTANLDKRFSIGESILTTKAVRRHLSSVPSDVDLGDVPARRMILNKSNRHFTNRELGRYQNAGTAVLRNEQFISMAGPDGTKMTSKLPISMAALMGQSHGMVAMGSPLVAPFLHL